MRLDGWNLGFGQTGMQPGSFATVTQDHKTAYIISADQPGMVQLLKADALTARDTDNLATRAVLQTAASSIVDMQVAEPTEELLILCDHPPRLIRQPLSGAEATTIPLAAPPARLAVQPATDARQVLVCVTLPQAQAVWLATLDQGAAPDGQEVSVAFSPRHVLAFEPAAFIVADSVGGKLALVNQEQGVSDCAEINGHHIGGWPIHGRRKSVDRPSTA